MSRMLIALLCLTAGAAWAEKPRISLVEFKGGWKASLMKKELAKKLCKTFTCVQPDSDDPQPVDAVVTAQLSKKGATVSVYFDEEQKPVTRELKLKGGKLPATAAKSVASAVREAVASGMDAEDAVALAGSP